MKWHYHICDINNGSYYDIKSHYNVTCPMSRIMVLLLGLFLQKKNGLSLSHLVPKIHGPKVVLIFYQNVLFNSF